MNIHQALRAIKYITHLGNMGILSPQDTEDALITVLDIFKETKEEN